MFSHDQTRLTSLCIFGKTTTEVKLCPSQCIIITVYMMLIYLTNGDFYFDYVANVVSAMVFLQLLFSPLQLISILWGGIL